MGRETMGYGLAWRVLVLALVITFLPAAEQVAGVNDPSGQASDGAPYTINLPVIQRPDPTFYVSVAGSDETGDGTAAHPWATIAYALQQVSDGAMIVVRPGTYHGEVQLRRRFESGVVIRASEPYRARLQNHDTVITCHICAGITLEGFEISHDGPGAGRYVVQIQDAAGNGYGGRRVTLYNNVIHDSYNNDLVKVNNGADEIVVAGNIFYNMGGPEKDSHLDINSATNVIVEDNIFFNSFAASNRPNQNNTGSFITVKDSNGTGDANLGSRNVAIRRNIFLNWEGDDGNAFITLGEDAVDYFQARDVLIENNLMLGNTENVIRAALQVRGSRDVTFRHNTVAGDLPAKAFAMRLTLAPNNLPNANVLFYNNIWSDPTGTMGAELHGYDDDFSDAVPADTLSFGLDGNLYWNGGQPVPNDPAELVNISDDPTRHVADPLLAAQEQIVLPVWQRVSGRFGDGSATIRDAFVRLVNGWGTPSTGSTAIDNASPAYAPAEDILGRPRSASAPPDIGAVEK